MRYKNVIITCKNNKDFIELQKHLFRLSYSWFDDGNKNRQIKRGRYEERDIFPILIQNDDRMLVPISKETFELYKVINFIRLIRNEKLKKLNNDYTPNT
jgi:hypothetical protein